VSYAAQAWVNEHAPYRGGVERAVLKELADAMNKDSELAWLGIDRLALDSGHHRASVCRALRTMLADGVIERVTLGGGRGIKSAYRVVMDKSRWTPSRATIAQAVERQRLRRELEDRRRNGLKARQYQERKRVAPRDSKSAQTVASGSENSRVGCVTTRSHQLYEPDLTGGNETVKPNRTERTEKLVRDPRVGKLIAELRAAMDKRARAGV
jgi:hypothetical protein